MSPINIEKFWALLVAVLALTLLGCEGDKGPVGPRGPVGPPGTTAFLMVPDDYVDIQTAVDALPTSGGTVFIRAGTYILNSGVHVNRSNVALVGEPGTQLRLAASVNQPVLLLGSDIEIPVLKNENLLVENLEIDGNMEAQTSETDPTRPWIRNNGIDVRAIEGLWVEKVTVHDARSGGFVVSWGSSRVSVSSSAFDRNFFDGIALYDSRDIQIANFRCMENGWSGLSLDNELSDVQFANGRIEGNGDNGIFARDSEDLEFYDLVISANAGHGCFLSHQQAGNGTGVSRLFFEGCSFLDNGGFGFWLNSSVADSPNNVVSNSLFSGNALGAIELSDGADLTQNGNVYQ